MGKIGEVTETTAWEAKSRPVSPNPPRAQPVSIDRSQQYVTTR